MGCALTRDFKSYCVAWLSPSEHLEYFFGNNLFLISEAVAEEIFPMPRGPFTVITKSGTAPSSKTFTLTRKPFFLIDRKAASLVRRLFNVEKTFVGDARQVNESERWAGLANNCRKFAITVFVLKKANRWRKLVLWPVFAIQHIVAAVNFKLDNDEWELISAEDRNAAHRDTFQIPTREKRESLAPGDAAKLLFDIETREEGRVVDRGVDRMWVIVKGRTESGYIGVLDSNPGTAENLHLREGDNITFGPEHVTEIGSPPREYVIKKYGASFLDE